MNTKTFTEEEMLRLAKTSNNLHALRIVASLNDLPEEVITTLLNREDERLTIVLLQNSCITLETLNHYVTKEFNPKIYKAIAHNINLTDNLAELLVENFNEEVGKALLSNPNTPLTVLEKMWNICLDGALEDFQVKKLASNFRAHSNASAVIKIESIFHPQVSYASKPSKTLIVQYLKNFYQDISEELPEEWLRGLLEPIIAERFRDVTK